MARSKTTTSASSDEETTEETTSKDEGVSAAEIAKLREELAELRGRVAATPPPKAEKSNPEPEKLVDVECVSHSYYKPGTTITRWGYDFVVGESGTDLVGKVPESDVTNGVRAGRWKPVGMTSEEAGEEYVRGQYTEIIGEPPRRSMTIQAMRGEISRFRAEQARAAGVGSLSGVKEPALRV